MPKTSAPSINQLRRAVAISEQIESLEAEIVAILGGATSASEVSSASKSSKKRRKMSPEAREKIAAAQRARWAKTKGEPGTPTGKPAKKKKRGKMSAEGRAAIVAAQKKRWAKVKREAK